MSRAAGRPVKERRGRHFQEVDEDLKRDQALELWRKYGRYIIAFAAAVVLGTAGVVAWNNYRESRREADGKTFAQAFQLVGRGDAAATPAMTDIAGHDGAYRILAQLQLAARSSRMAATRQAPLRSTTRSPAMATPSSPSATCAILLGATRLRRYRRCRGHRQEAAAAARRHVSLPALGLEIEGLLQMKAGNYVAAHKSPISRLADDVTAPTSLRQRATQILAWIGEL